MYAVGIDIGYSNLKVVHGEVGAHAPKNVSLPAGAVRLEHSKLEFRGGPGQTTVLVDDIPWVVGQTQQGLLVTSQRQLDADYTSSEGYRALFHLGLLQTGREHIDVLITGLPVSLCLEPGRTERLQKQLTGRHRVAKNLTINVDRVHVVPQPGGSMMIAAVQPNLRRFVENGFVSIVDPGFYSTDWLTLDGGRLNERLSGTNMRAVSVILEETAETIRRAEGSRPTLEALEQAVRTTAKTILVDGREYEFWPSIATAARNVGLASVRQITNQLRTEDRRLDLAILTGGGASIYKDLLSSVMPRTRIECLPDSVTANARGFWASVR